jgi:acyl-CoA hydrolase
MKSKFCKDSIATMMEIVLPNDTNTLGNLMGGRLMHLMDIVGAISAQRHSNRIVVTAGVDSIDFKSSVRLGEIVNLKAFVTRTFNTSMEVFIEVFAENMQNGEKRLCNRAFFTFVAVDQSGNPIPINPVVPETTEEIEMYNGALRRRELRLLLAGRITPEDAKSLHDFLIVKK